MIRIPDQVFNLWTSVRLHTFSSTLFYSIQCFSLKWFWWLKFEAIAYGVSRRVVFPFVTPYYTRFNKILRSNFRQLIWRWYLQAIKQNYNSNECRVSVVVSTLMSSPAVNVTEVAYAIRLKSSTPADEERSSLFPFYLSLFTVFIIYNITTLDKSIKLMFCAR